MPVPDLAQAPWERLPGDGSTTDFESVFFIDANTGWIAAEDGKILHTTDGGSSWQAQTVATSRDLESILVGFVPTNKGFAVQGQRVTNSMRICYL